MYQALPISVEVGLLLEDLLAALDPNNDHYTTRDIIAALPHTKLTYLGNGAFGVAASAFLSDGREIVLKLAGVGDDGYPWWAEYCKNNPGKHLPEVYHTARVGAIHVTAMKRYAPLGYDQEMAVRACYYGEPDRDPELAEAITRVRDLIEDLRGAVDMHLGNYMSDPETGEIVITDPCSYMPPERDYTPAPQQFEMKFELSRMDTAINSLLGALRKAEELHGEARPVSKAGKVDKDMLRWNLPKDRRLLDMDFADDEACVGVNFIQNK